MKNTELGQVYSKAFLELSKENGDNITQDLTQLVELMNKSESFEQLLFLNVFSLEEKATVLLDIIEKLKLGKTAKTCLLFLVSERRLGLLPQIYKNLIVIEDSLKGFINAEVEGSEGQLDSEVEQKLIALLKQKLNQTPQFNYKKDPKITAGYKVTVGDYMIDATVDSQFKKFQNQFLK